MHAAFGDVYLHMIGQCVDKFKSRDPAVAAHDAYIFGVFAVWNTNPVGWTQSQRPLFSSALEIVKPDGSLWDRTEIKVSSYC